MASRLQDVILRGLASAKPLATAVAPGTLYYSTDAGVTQRSNGTAWESYNDTTGGGGGGGPHAPTHSAGGTDPIDVKDLAGYPGTTSTFLRGDHTFAIPTSTPIAHHATHEPGGTDPMAVDAAVGTGSLRTLGTGANQAAPGNDSRFSGPTTPTAHAASHSAGGSDPVTVTNLAGYPGGTTNFLRADGTFAAPAGGGGGITALTGDVTASGTGSVPATIANDAVTYAKMQNVSAASRLLGRASSGAGDTEEITLGSNLSMVAGALTYTPPTKNGSIEMVIDGAGVAITTGLKGFLEIPFACTIVGVTLLADVSGSIVVDIWKDTYANYPPTVTDTIVASAKPTISSAVKSQNTTLTGWTTAITAGDVLGFNVDSAATITKLTLSLKVALL